MSQLTIADVDVNKITFGKVKREKNKVDMVPVFHDGRFLVLQTPEGKTPFPPSKFSSEKDNDEGKKDTKDEDDFVKETLDLAFENIDNRKSMKSFFDFMNNLQEKTLHHVIENRETYFGYDKNGNVYSPDFVKEFCNNSIRKPTKKDERGIKRVIEDKPPFLRLNLYKKNGQYLTKIVNNRLKPMNISSPNIFRNAYVTPIIQCNGIWIGNKQFGIKWSVKMLRVVPQKNDGLLSFKPDMDRLAEDDDNESEKEEESADNGHENNNIQSSKFIPDDEEEDEEGNFPK